MAKQRRRKSGPREPNGRLQRERVEDIKSVAFAQRRKLGAKGDEGDYEWHFAIGRAYKRGQVQQCHLKAAEHYQRICITFARIKGQPSPFPRTSQLMFEDRGQSNKDFDDDFVRRATQQYQDAYCELNCCGHVIVDTVHKVVKEDQDCLSWPEHRVKQLVVGLDALVDFFKIPREEVDAA